jgi:radical SAM superfamily enzyme YgiQ (UPF0313 family)
VIQEVQAWADRGMTYVFFADDNFVGHRAYAKDLLRALARWNGSRREALTFYTQASIDMARDEELLALLRDANFVMVFIGIESPRKASLAETRKTQNERLDLVAAVHKVQSYNLFVAAGMIVGFDQDDAAIFDEQYAFLQAAHIPIVMLSVLLAVPKTPLYRRLEAAGRLGDLAGDAVARYLGTSGGTNFRPLNMTAEELRRGQEGLYRRLYAPGAFAERLLGNLGRFHDVTYRPEAVRPDALATFLRLAGYYWRLGRAARRFFWGVLGRAVRRSPRTAPQVAQFLGMFKHFCELHAHSPPWDPWANDE